MNTRFQPTTAVAGLYLILDKYWCNFTKNDTFFAPYRAILH